MPHAGYPKITIVPGAVVTVGHIPVVEVVWGGWFLKFEGIHVARKVDKKSGGEESAAEMIGGWR